MKRIDLYATEKSEPLCRKCRDEVLTNAGRFSFYIICGVCAAIESADNNEGSVSDEYEV